MNPGRDPAAGRLLPATAAGTAAGGAVEAEEDEALLRGVREGELGALERLVARKRERAYRLARHVVGDEDDAKDVVQIAFIRVWRMARRYRAGSGFDAWFHRIVVNLAIDFRRRRGARRRGIEGLGTAAAVRPTPPRAELPGSLRAGEVRAIFDDLARALPPRQRAVFALREIEGMEGAEVATLLRMRESTVRNHLFQARRTLRKALLERYPEYMPARRSD